MKRKTMLIEGAAAFAATIGASFCPRRARASDAPTSLRIGYQKIGALLILKERGILEARLATQAVNVSWVQFPSGSPLIEALNAGAIDFGYAGDTPPIFAQAAGVDFVYVASIPQPGATKAILVRDAAEVHSLADLRGKKIALAKGSSAQNVLVQALKRAKLAWSDITPIYLQPPDAGAALRAGSVDAWSIWDPFFALGERFPNVHVLTTAVGVAPSNDFFLASRTYAKQHGETITTIIDAARSAWKWAQTHQPDLARVLADASGVPLEVESVVAARTDFEVAAVSPLIIRQQQAIADTFHSLGLIPRPVSIAAAVWSPRSAFITPNLWRNLT